VTELALLRAVIDDPDHDAPRLVYADWLLDYGDPRGEYIVLQCKLATLSVRDPDYRGLASRSIDLFNQHRRAWCAALRPGTAVLFRRGLPWSVECDVANDPLALLDLAPIQHLKLRNDTDCDLLPIAQRMAADARLARLSRLVLATPWGERAFAALVAGPHGHALRELSVGGQDCGLDAIRAMCESMSGLRALELDGGLFGIQPNCVASLAAPGFSALRCLALRNVALNDRGARILASAPHLTDLVELDLGIHSAETVARSEINRNQIADAGAQALAGSRNFLEVRRLVLDGNRISSRGLYYLAHTSAFATLRELSLRSNDIDDDGLRTLAIGAAAPTLDRLDLAANYGITGAGIAALAESPRLATITALDLRRCAVGLVGARALAESPHVANLRDLDLSYCSIDNDGARALAESAALDGIEQLRLSGNAIDNATQSRLRARFGSRAYFVS
jgi:uncharacterized protein (TIGR02996 family)